MKTLLLAIFIFISVICQGQNIALNKSVTVSSNENSTNIAIKAVDGNTNTRWSSKYSDPQWIYVDLGSILPIGTVTLKWELAYGTAYQIQVSVDAITWNTVFSTITGDGGTDQINFAPVNARYVRMYGISRATGYGYSLWEFEIYGSIVIPPVQNCDSIPILKEQLNNLIRELTIWKDSIGTKNEVIKTLNEILSKQIPLNRVKLDSISNVLRHAAGFIDSIKLPTYIIHNVDSVYYEVY